MSSFAYRLSRSSQLRTYIKGSQLIDYIWQGDMEYVEEHALTVVVGRLRNKLCSDTEYIKTVYGVGYTWMGI